MLLPETVTISELASVPLSVNVVPLIATVPLSVHVPEVVMIVRVKESPFFGVYAALLAEADETSSIYIFPELSLLSNTADIGLGGVVGAGPLPPPPPHEAKENPITVTKAITPNTLNTFFIKNSFGL